MSNILLWLFYFLSSLIIIFHILVTSAKQMYFLKTFLIEFKFSQCDNTINQFKEKHLPLLPPEVLVVSYGLQQRPYKVLYDSHQKQSSGVIVTPKGIAPACFNKVTASESNDALNPFLAGRPTVNKQPKIVRYK